jgi:CRISPR/Cas system CMR subunit Cmr6 (Cas7 group RAMP superfamily)
MVNRDRVRHRAARCGGKFEDYVYVEENKCKGMCTRQELIDALKMAFTKGLGAKTALGYGKFNTRQPPRAP